MSHKSLQPEPGHQPETSHASAQPSPVKEIASRQMVKQIKRIKSQTKPRQTQRENDQQRQNWQTIIWREWATSKDEEYAQHLFALVGETRIGWGSTLVMALTSTLYGLLAGYLLGLVLVYWHTRIEQWVLTEPLALVLTWLVGMAGGLVGTGISWGVSWRMWLNALTPKIFNHKISQLAQFNMALLVGFVANLAGVSLGWSIFLGIIAGLIMLDINQGGGISSGILGGDIELSQRNELMGIVLVSGFGSLVGHIFMQGNWTSLVVGIMIGMWIGVIWSGVLLGILASWIGVLAGLALGLDNWLVGWLSLGVGFGLGVIPNLVGNIGFRQAYQHRSQYFWWQEQPPTYKVELALQLAQQALPQEQATWAEPLRRLTIEAERPTPPDTLIARLESQNWVDRFVARHALVTIGGTAAEALRGIAAGRDNLLWGNPLWETALWLLVCIERETTDRLAWRAPYILCPHCLARFNRREVELWLGVSFTYYGCRLCGQSHKFLDCPAGVAAVLDTTWPEPLSYHHGLLRVNYLTRPVLFDFDRVEIVRAGDEEAERLAMRAGNDTDPFRASRYRQIPCLVRPEAGLSENSLRVLDRIFGRIEVKKKEE